MTPLVGANRLASHVDITTWALCLVLADAVGWQESSAMPLPSMQLANDMYRSGYARSCFDTRAKTAAGASNTLQTSDYIHGSKWDLPCCSCCTGCHLTRFTSMGVRFHKNLASSLQHNTYCQGPKRCCQVPGMRQLQLCGQASAAHC